MTQLRVNLILDEEHLSKVFGYYIYRSEEKTGNRPTIDGVYIQRKCVGENPPWNMKLSLEWESPVE